MKRLVWKEFREQIWFALAALAAPLTILLFIRTAFHDSDAWPGEPSSLYLTYIVFAFWGATRMPHERESSRLTIVALPVRHWHVWPLKALPGIAVAVASSFLVYAAGKVGVRDEAMLWVSAGGMALAYSSAFLISLFGGVGVSAVFGFIASTAGWGILWESLGQQSKTSEYQTLWLLVATLIAVSACVMTARAGGTSSRRAGLATSAVYVAVIAAAVISAIGTRKPQVRDELFFSSRVIVSQPAGLAAYAEDVWEQRPLRRKSQRLWAMKLDGTSRRLVSDAGALAPIMWMDGGQLLYIQRGRGAENARLMLWNPKTGATRVVMSKLYSRYSSALPYSYVRAAASEPDGERVALVCYARGRPLSRWVSELRVLNLRTGGCHLLWPGADGTPCWRHGRIYIIHREKLWSISPNGGELHREIYLPPAEGGESVSVWEGGKSVWGD